MAEKRMLIVPAELVDKINANRGDMSQEDFLHFLIDSRLNGATKKEESLVTQEALQDFEEGIKELLRSFMDFFVSYGLELGQGSGKTHMEALTQRLQEVSGSPGKKSGH